MTNFSFLHWVIVRLSLAIGTCEQPHRLPEAVYLTTQDVAADFLTSVDTHRTLFQIPTSFMSQFEAYSPTLFPC